MGEKRKRPSGDEGMSQAKKEAPMREARNVVPRPGPDSEAFPGERRSDDDRPGSQTGTIGGGGADAHNPSPERAATGVDETTTAKP